MDNLNYNKEELFNGAIESGIRSAILLEAFYPRALDLNSISLLDYFVVHTADIGGGPTSLHPAISSRFGEYRVRRRVIQDGLKLLTRRNLISPIESREGLLFLAGDDAPAFIKLLTTDYNLELQNRAYWLATQATQRASFFDEMRHYIEQHSLVLQIDEGYAIAEQ